VAETVLLLKNNLLCSWRYMEKPLDNHSPQQWDWYSSCVRLSDWLFEEL